MQASNSDTYEYRYCGAHSTGFTATRRLDGVQMGNSSHEWRWRGCRGSGCCVHWAYCLSGKGSTFWPSPSAGPTPSENLQRTCHPQRGIVPQGNECPTRLHTFFLLVRTLLSEPNRLGRAYFKKQPSREKRGSTTYARKKNNAGCSGN